MQHKDGVARYELLWHVLCGTMYNVCSSNHRWKKAFYHFFELVLHPKLLHFHLLFFNSFVWFRQQNYSLGLMHPIKENKSTVSLIIHLTFHVHGMHTYKTFSWLFYTFFYMFKRSLLIFLQFFFVILILFIFMNRHL